MTALSAEQARIWRQTLRTLALVAGLFCLVVAAMLAATILQLQINDPLNSPALTELKQRFDETGDQELARHVRELDWLARKAFFASRRQVRNGAVLLAAGIVFAGACLAIGEAGGRPEVTLPTRGGATENRWRNSGKARVVVGSLTAIGGLAVLVAAFILSKPQWLGFEKKSRPGDSEMFPPSPVGGRPAVATIPRGAGWPHFRGWAGVGRAEAANPPLVWNLPEGENVIWRREIPLPGFSSPVVWDGLVVVTGADADNRLVVAYDLATGEERWRHRVEGLDDSPSTPPEVTDDTGYAASTPAISATAIGAIFANGDLVCLDLAGNRKWGFNLGTPDNHYGHSSSLLIDGNVLYVQYDHKAEASLMAFDIDSGRMLWDVERESISWGSPALVETADGRKHLILVDEFTVRGYDPGDGSLLWQEACLSGEVGPSPAYDNGIVFVANEFAQASGVRIDAAGDSEVLWAWSESLPDVASPVAAEGRLYLATSFGEVVCLNGTDGTVVWLMDFDHGFYSSPIVVDDRVYLTNLRGRTMIFTTGDEFNLLAENDLGAACYATPAFVDGKILFRLDRTLICIGAPPLP